MGAGGTKSPTPAGEESESQKVLKKLSPHQQERWEESVIRTLKNQNTKGN